MANIQKIACSCFLLCFISFSIFARIPVHHYQITHTYPHLTSSFTEGLFFDHGNCYESSGLYKQSQLLEWDFHHGKSLKRLSLKPKYFAEGIAVIGDLLYQLTYQSRVAFVYAKKTFILKKTFSYPEEIHEGWGLTTDGKKLIMSDGSDKLYFINPKNFKIQKTLEVTAEGKPVDQLNSLACIHEKIYANIWHSDTIAIIHPKSGKVVGWIDLKNINPTENEGENILNGIAYDPTSKTLLVTGKRWSKIFELKLQ